jgi:hypothetical protein
MDLRAHSTFAKQAQSLIYFGSSFDDFISSEKQLRGEYHAKRVSGLLINDE